MQRIWIINIQGKIKYWNFVKLQILWYHLFLFQDSFVYVKGVWSSVKKNKKQGFFCSYLIGGK